MDEYTEEEKKAAEKKGVKLPPKKKIAEKKVEEEKPKVKTKQEKAAEALKERSSFKLTVGVKESDKRILVDEDEKKDKDKAKKDKRKKRKARRGQVNDGISDEEQLS